jgi:hypothetical protein
MAFGTGSFVTNVGKGIIAKRMLGATPAQAEPKYLAIGTGATAAARTAAAGDTALSSEQGARVAGTGSTVTTTNANDTYQNVGTVTAGGALAVDEAGTFDASTVGNMFTSFTFPVVNLASGDSLALTIKVQNT